MPLPLGVGGCWAAGLASAGAFLATGFGQAAIVAAGKRGRGVDTACGGRGLKAAVELAAPGCAGDSYLPSGRWARVWDRSRHLVSALAVAKEAAEAAQTAYTSGARLVLVLVGVDQESGLGARVHGRGSGFKSCRDELAAY